MYKIFETQEATDKYSAETSGFVNGYSVIEKIDAGFLLLPVSEFNGYVNYNAIVNAAIEYATERGLNKK